MLFTRTHKFSGTGKWGIEEKGKDMTREPNLQDPRVVTVTLHKVDVKVNSYRDRVIA